MFYHMLWCSLLLAIPFLTETQLASQNTTRIIESNYSNKGKASLGHTSMCSTAGFGSLGEKGLIKKKKTMYLAPIIDTTEQHGNLAHTYKWRMGAFHFLWKKRKKRLRGNWYHVSWQKLLSYAATEEGLSNLYCG